MVYYRIKQTYLGGSYSYSPIVYAKQKSLDDQIKISGMSNGNIAIFFPNKMKTNVNVKVQSLNGHIIMQNTLNKPGGHIILQVPYNARGWATITLTDGELLRNSQIVILL
jgi:hypothetical protein